MGARTGAATVALESAEQASLALKQRRYYRDQRYIEVCTKLFRVYIRQG